MKKKIAVLSIILIIIVAFIIGIIYIKSNSTDAAKFKKEYESLNGTKSKKNGQKIRSITIPKANPIIYKTADELVKMIEDKETFAVYFGFPDCPWCRSVLPTLLEVANDQNIEKLYYVDVKEIRDTLELDKENKVITKEKGSKGYQNLLKKLDKVLDSYYLTNDKGDKIDTKEKRIYAPNIVVVINGVAKEMTSGISDKQEDGYSKITTEIEKDMYNKIKCTLECLNKEASVCTSKAC